MTIHRMFHYKLERQKNEEHEDCWPLLNTTGGAPGTKRQANILRIKGQPDRKGRGKKDQRQCTIVKAIQKQEKRKSQAGRRNVPPTPPARKQKGENEKKEWNWIRTVQH